MQRLRKLRQGIAGKCGINKNGVVENIVKNFVRAVQRVAFGWINAVG